MWVLLRLFDVLLGASYRLRLPVPLPIFPLCLVLFGLIICKTTVPYG
jgi:hypothetical protein